MSAAASEKPARFPGIAVEALLQRQLEGKARLLSQTASQKPQFPPPTTLESDSADNSSGTRSEERHEEKRAGEEAGGNSEGQGTENNSISDVYVHTTKGEDLNAYVDAEHVVRAKATEIARLLRVSKNVLVFTGAGISTAAKLPDYRSKNGLWRKKERGEALTSSNAVSLADAEPTSAHRALVELSRRGFINAVITTNIDNLHGKALLRGEQQRREKPVNHLELVELHGNAFQERCAMCGRSVMHETPVVQDLTALTVNETARRCGADSSSGPCEGLLQDTVVRFGGSLNEHVQARAFELASTADLVLVLGTSMRVSPACNMPRVVFKNGGKMILVNQQKTAFEDEMWVHAFASIDAVLDCVLQELGNATSHSVTTE